MNDQQPHAGYVTDATRTTGSFSADPLFGTYATTDYDAGQGGYTQYQAYEYGAYSTGDHAASGTQWDTGSYGSGAYAATAQWDTTAWSDAQQTGTDDSTGTYDATAFAEYGSHTGYDTATAQWTTPGFETGAYDATAWNQAAPDPLVPQQYTPEQYGEPLYEQQAYAEPEPEPAPAADPTPAPSPEAAPAHDAFHDAETMIAMALGPELDTVIDLAGHQDGNVDGELATRAARRSGGGSRGRRRTPAKRSALLTVAVPSACVMGVAGIAAASVGGLTDNAPEQKDDTTSLAAADPASVKQIAANSKLDTQLAALSADARDFGDRASRTQERIDLKLREDAARKKREEEAARKEALRPKFMLPVKLHQLSARFGQSGVNWMSVHTGIDFPVQTGTPVMAATDGTVRTQLNSAYGNMVIVTAPDGTETWYCHLSSAKIRSGKVQAGDVIAYSGDTGNSTGPHLHFEVRPNGGAAIDPLPWLLHHGLNPLS